MNAQSEPTEGSSQPAKTTRLYSPAGSAHQLPFYKQIAAGGMAGLCEVLCMYPLDVVKTRLQLQAAGDTRYTSVWGTFRDIIKTEGVANFYRGIISPILAEAPKRAIKFSTNEQYKKMFGSQHTYQHMLSGASAGMTEAIINCPFEVVKVRMQARTNLGLYKSTADAASKIIRNEGFFALYKGFEAQAWRNGIWNGIYFGVINMVRNALPKPESPGSTLGTNFVAGVVSSTIATTVNTPFDVVKSRVQNTLPGQPAKYGWTIPACFTIAREEGLKALWKGYVPKLMRLAPGGGIMLVAFDFFAKLLA